MTEVNTEEMVEGRCEFCGRRYWLDPVGMRALHEVPFCNEFGAMDPLTFAIKNREIKQAKMPKA